MKRIIFLSMLFLLNSCGKDENTSFRNSENSEEAVDLNNQMLDFVEQEESEEVEELIKKGANPNAKSPNADPYLITAIKNGDIKTMEVLLKGDADPNVVDENGKRALSHARGYKSWHFWDKEAWFGDTKKAMIDLLEQYGAVPPEIIVERGTHYIGIAKNKRASLKKEEASLNEQLQWAVEQGESEKVEELIKKGADPNADIPNLGKVSSKVEYFLNDQLQWAVEQEKSEKVEEFIKKGADPNADIPNVPPLLITAIKNGDIKTMEVLLKAGADPNIVDENGKSALSHARGYKSWHFWDKDFWNTDTKKAMIDLLEQYSEDLEAEDTPSTPAPAVEDLEAEDTPSTPAPAVEDLEAEDTPSTPAPAVEDLEAKDTSSTPAPVVEDLEAKDTSSTPAPAVEDLEAEDTLRLIIAIKKGDIETMELLLEAGADPNIVDENGKSALSHARGYKSWHFWDKDFWNTDTKKAMIDLLEQYSEELEAEDTPSIPAPVVEDLEADTPSTPAPVVEDLEAKDTSSTPAPVVEDIEDTPIEEIEDTPSTPAPVVEKLEADEDTLRLIIAIKKGDIETMELLLEAGADPNVVDENGKSALSHARGYKSWHFWDKEVWFGDTKKAMIDLLEQYGAVPPEIIVERGTHYIGIAKNKRASLNKEEASLNEQLQWAVEQGESEKVEEFIKKGADPNADIPNVTPLLITAIKNGDIKTMEVLLKGYADPNVVDENGKSALSHARGYKIGDEEVWFGDTQKAMIDLLEQYGAVTPEVEVLKSSPIIIAP